MKTKPNRREGDTRLRIIMWLLDSEDKRLTISQMRPLAEKELEITSVNALYPHLQKLTQSELVEPRVGYALPTNWKQGEYLIKLLEYFGYERLIKPPFFNIIKSEYPSELAIMFYDYLRLERQISYEERLMKYKPNSKRKREVEMRWHCDGLYYGMLYYGAYEVSRIEKKRVISRLREIDSVDDLKGYQEELEAELKLNDGHRRTNLKGIFEDACKVHDLIEDEYSSKVVQMIGLYVRNRVVDVLRDEGWISIKSDDKGNVEELWHIPSPK